MTPLTAPASPRAPLPAGTPAALVAGAIALVLVLPPALFGFLAWRQFEMFRFTWYVPHEELAQALRTLDPGRLFHAPLFVANMTSGLLVSNMFTLTVGQLVLSLVLGAAVGTSLLAGLRSRRRLGVVLGVVLALAATASASATGLVGCHPGLAGGLVTLMGVGAPTAAMLATWSPLAQATIAAALFLAAARLRR